MPRCRSTSPFAGPIRPHRMISAALRIRKTHGVSSIPKDISSKGPKKEHMRATTTALSRKSISSKFRAGNAVRNEVLPAGESWIHQIKAGQVIRIVDLEGCQAVDALFYSAW